MEIFVWCFFRLFRNCQKILIHRFQIRTLPPDGPIIPVARFLSYFLNLSLRGVKRRSNLSFGGARDCFAALAMTG
jgi:hypothetical protein